MAKKNKKSEAARPSKKGTGAPTNGEPLSKQQRREAQAKRTLHGLGIVGRMSDFDDEDESPEDEAPKPAKSDEKPTGKNPKNGKPNLKPKAEDDAPTSFFNLRRTAEGEKRKKRNQLRASKKTPGSMAPSDEAETPEPLRPYENYDPTRVSKLYDSAIAEIRKDHFGKALDLRNGALTSKLIDAFLNMDEDLPNRAVVSATIEKLIRIGKSFYEYDDKHRSYLSDEDYDAIVARWRLSGQVEPTGIVPNGDKKVAITYPLLHNNMDKAYVVWLSDPIPEGVQETDRVEAFLQRVYSANKLSPETAIILELSPKIDGVSLNGTIKGDQLRNPQTRGDDTSSVAVKGMDRLQVGEGINEKEPFGIQYEAFVTEEDRLAASKYLKLATPYVSCRHAASGLIQRLATAEDDNLLQFISLYPIEAEGLEENYAERMDYISNYGIMPKDMIRRLAIKGNFKTLLRKIEAYFAELAEKRETLSYAIDGMVITVVDDDYRKACGRNGRTNLYQIALKFNPAMAEGVVKGTHLDTGRKGFRTIQVDLKHPVFLDGVRYDHIPVLSYGIYEQMDLREGSVVTVRRVGDVIPSITVKERGNGKRLPPMTHCPQCWERLSIKDKKLYCANPQCPGNLVGRITGFIDALEMDGYGDEFAEMLVEKFGPDATGAPINIRYMADLFMLTPEGFKAVGVNTKAAAAFPDLLREKVGSTPDWKILGAIGVPGIGPARAKMILKEFGGWENFISSLDALVLDVRLYKALGEAVGKKVFDALRLQNGHENYVADLQEVTHFMGNFTKSWKESSTKVGHTGLTLSSQTRDLCERLGYDIVDNQSFTILIAGDKNSSSAKARKARTKNIPMFTEKEFLDKYSKKLAAMLD